MRHGQALRSPFAQDRSPVSQFGILGLLDVVDYVLVGQHLHVREGCQYRLQTKVEVGVTGADIDGGQLLATLLDHVDQRLTILYVELGIDQDGLFIARYQRGGDREDRLFTGVVDGHAQRARQNGATQQGGGQSQVADQGVVHHVFLIKSSGVHLMDRVY